MKKVLTIAKWVFAFALAGVFVYLGYEVRAWFLAFFKDGIPTKPKEGETLKQTQRGYVDSQYKGMPKPKNVGEAVTQLKTGGLSPWEILKLYASSLNPFKYL